MAENSRITALELTRDILRNSDWVNHTPRTNIGEHCLMTAWQLALDKLKIPGSLAGPLHTAARERGYDTIVAFNDRGARSKADIESLIARAIEIEEAKFPNAHKVTQAPPI